MSILNQKTLKQKVKFEGIGLHTGKEVSVTVYPARKNTGIIFRRIDIKNNNFTHTMDNISLATQIANNCDDIIFEY